jgi:hypothetical protein
MSLQCGIHNSYKHKWYPENIKLIQTQTWASHITQVHSTTTHTTKPHANTGRELLLVTEGRKLIVVIVNSTFFLKVLLKTTRCGHMLELRSIRDTNTTWRRTTVGLILQNELIQQTLTLEWVINQVIHLLHHINLHLHHCYNTQRTSRLQHLLQ